MLVRAINRSSYWPSGSRRHPSDHTPPAVILIYERRFVVFISISLDRWAAPILWSLSYTYNHPYYPAGITSLEKFYSSMFRLSIVSEPSLVYSVSE